MTDKRATPITPLEEAWEEWSLEEIRQRGKLEGAHWAAFAAGYRAGQREGQQAREACDHQMLKYDPAHEAWRCRCGDRYVTTRDIKALRSEVER